MVRCNICSRRRCSHRMGCCTFLVKRRCQVTRCMDRMQPHVPLSSQHSAPSFTTPDPISARTCRLLRKPTPPTPRDRTIPAPANGGQKDAAVQACNLDYWAFLTDGACWHNNHHAFPELARMGLARGQLDIGWKILKIMAKTWIGAQPRLRALRRLEQRSSP